MRLIASVLVVLLVLTMSAPTSRAQTPLTVNDQTVSGDTPFGSYSVGDIDQVQLASGALDVRLPLFSHGGRGLPDSRFWHYSNKIWFVQSVPRPPLAPLKLWSHVDDQDFGSTSENVSCGGETFQVIHHFIYKDQSNTSHVFDAFKTLGHHCYTDQLIGHVTDGSGMTVDITNLSQPVVRLKDGTQITIIARAAAQWEDSNGNFITAVADGEVDTLGRKVQHATGTLPDGAQFEDWISRDSAGVQRTTRIEWINVSVSTNFTDGTVTQYANTLRLARKIDLPNSLAYQFTYDSGTTAGHFGDLIRIDLPTGGYIRYAHTTIANFDQSSRAVSQRIVSADGTAAGEKTWTYAYQMTTPDAFHNTTTVTDPNGDQSVHIFAIPSTCNLSLGETLACSPSLEVTAKYYHGTAAAGTLLRTVNTDYQSTVYNMGSTQFMSADTRPIRVTTILDSGLTTKVETDYDPLPDTNGPIAFSRSSVVEKREYSYAQGSPGALARKTDYTYLHNSNSAYATANLVDLVASQTLYDGSGNKAAQTNNSYDSTPLTATSGVVQHDYANYSSTHTVRGNGTALSRWRNTDGAFLTTTQWRDDLGNSLQTQDPLGHNAFFSYADSWANTTCAPASGSATAFPTQVTDHLGHINRGSYNSCSNTLASVTDPNNQTSTFSYDLLNRLIQTNLPDGGLSTKCYTDVGGAACTQGVAPFSIVATKKINTAANLASTTVFDGLGRVSQSQLSSDPDGATFTATVYDALGRTSQQYNPTRCSQPTTNCGESTWGFTGYAYDPLSRVTSVTAQDGSPVTTSYSGNCTTVTDPAGKARKFCVDAPGRITGVWEDPSVLNYETDYTYDALNNLVGVVQNGSRNRTFTYNSLSQLLTAANPESGTVTYAYDAAGNLLNKTSPAPNQAGSATVTLSYCYDALNRLLSKAYTLQSCPMTSPVVTYSYDQGTSAANPIGRRTGMTDAAGSASWMYDSMGRPSIQRRTTNGITMTTAYTYNLDGSVATLTYPSGRTITYASGGAGRPLSAVDLDNGVNYALGASYAPQGALSSLLLGQTSSFGGINLNQGYSNRLQPASIRGWSTTAVALDLAYCFYPVVNGVCQASQTNNGNVTRIVNKRDNTRSQNFTYDSLNRIATAYTDGNLWGETFQIDAWGNLNQIAAYPGKPQAENLTQTAGTNNRFVGMSYDAAGNLLNDGASGYSYDAENKIVLGAGVTYTYDGDGNRVQKSTGKLYWYGMGGDVLDESDASGNITDEYAFFNASRVARRHVTSCQTDAVSYYFADHLGSSRIVTDGAGNVLDDSDFYPFGGERQILSSSGNTYKFASKERDGETGLDDFGARYDSSSTGRFMTPDSPSYSNHKNPQSWNLYAYSLNNPVTFRDADGHKVLCSGTTQEKQKCQQDAANSTANAEAKKRVTTETKQHGWWIFKWTETSIKITGDINSFRALSTNAAKLADLVTSKDTVTVSYGASYSPAFGENHSLEGGSTSVTPTQHYPPQAFIDPYPQPGSIYDPDAIENRVPQANTGEEFAHEVLGHIWGDMFGGAPAGTRGNMRDSIAAEDAVRALDPTRGQKAIESHHNYQAAPEQQGPDD